MAQAFVENIDYDGDSPVQTKEFEDDLQYFLTIDQATESWLNSLHHIWSLWKKSAGVTQTLYEYFETAPNPYLSALRILVNSNDFYHIKPKFSLTFTVIEEFARWIAPLKDKYKHCLDIDLKIIAFRLVSKQKNMQLMKMVSDVYEFISSNRYFIRFIKEKIKEKKFKEAGQFAEILKLQSSFSDPEVLILPLILQNKLIIAENLLKDQPDIQRKVVSYLDNLLAPNNNMQLILNQFITENEIPDVKISTYQHKSMAKLVARLAKLYHIPPELCLNLHKKRGEGALQFLVYKRYVDESLSIESWREMAKEAIETDLRLQVEVLKMLVNANDNAEALYFAQMYNVPRNEWPWHLRNYVDNLDSANQSEVNDSLKQENWDEDNNGIYYTLTLPRDRIKIIDDTKSFEDFLDYGLRDINIVGIDSEWKPSFSFKKPELALIQIATDSNVYIFDVTTLGNNVQHLWAELGIILFNNKNILKLGFGIDHDINVIRESLPALSNIKACSDGYLDFSNLWKKLLKEDNFVFPYKGDENFSNKNLSKLVELCLGQRLNKSDQFSNWERRPLRKSQIVYAALDAYCLLEIYNALAAQCDRLGISCQDLCNHMHYVSQKTLTNDVSHQSSRNKSKKSYEKNDCSGMQFESVQSQTHQVFNKLVQNHQNTKSLRSHHSSRSSNGKNVSKKPSYEGPSHSQDKMHFENYNHVPQKPINSYNQKSKNRNWQSNSQHDVHAGVEHSTDQASVGFVCDSMLGGLARQLRKCGLDCVYFANDRRGDQSLDAAIEDKRILLTRNGNFERFKHYLSSGYCYKVMEYKPEDQLLEVLRYFNIEVSEADIFSRCQICNTNEFVYVSKDTMSQLFQRFGKNYHKYPGPSTTNTNDLYNHWDTADKARHICESNMPTQKQFSCRTWQLSYGSLNMTKCTTKYNAKVQINQVPPNILQYVNKFYVCEGCGKIYWYGSHMERVLNGSLKTILA